MREERERKKNKGSLSQLKSMYHYDNYYVLLLPQNIYSSLPHHRRHNEALFSLHGVYRSTVCHQHCGGSRSSPPSAHCTPSR